MMTRRLFLKTGGIALFSLGVGAGPGFLTRAAMAAQGPGSTSSRRRKVLVTIFQRGAMDGLAAVPPIDDSLKTLRPRLAMTRRPRGRGPGAARPRHRLRPPPGARAAAAALEGEAARHRPRRRLARSDALALRRPGLHGDRHPRPQGDAERLAQPRRRPLRPRRLALPRGGDDRLAAALALRRRAGPRGHQPGRLQGAAPRRRPHRRRRRPGLRGALRADLPGAAARHRQRDLPGGPHALGGARSRSTSRRTGRTIRRRRSATPCGRSPS